jgi:DNA-binding transcriptional LysR family regulator
MRFANLEQQLGVQLFDRDRTRKPTPTDVGASVLSEARTVSMGVDSLRAKIRGRFSGLDLPLSGAVVFTPCRRSTGQTRRPDPPPHG